MKKELICYINTNIEGDSIRVSRVDDGTNKHILLKAGEGFMIVDIAELLDAVGAIGHYSTLFSQEEKIRAARDAKAAPVAQAPKAKEDEDAVVFQAQIRTGPTASELALERQTRLMQGDTLEVKALVNGLLDKAQTDLDKK